MTSYILEEDKIYKLLELFDEMLGDSIKHYSTKQQICYDCPTCSQSKGLSNDGKGNLEINYGDGVFNCWSCGEIEGTRGKIPYLFKLFGNNELLKKFYSLKILFNDENSLVDEGKKQNFHVSLPKDFISLKGKEKYSGFKSAFKYLENRGIDKEIIEKYNIGFCLDGIYENRVIIPSYDIDQDINYFVTRTINPHIKKLKYLNPSVDKKYIIFNENFIDWKKPLFLVEGVFDHLVLPNSVPLLGKVLSDKLFNEIYKNSENNVIIVLDGDAVSDAKKIYNKLNGGRLYNKILLCFLPDNEDVSSYYSKYGKDGLKNWLKNNLIRLKF